MPAASEAVDHLDFHAFFLHDTRLVLGGSQPSDTAHTSASAADNLGAALNRLFLQPRDGLPALRFAWQHPFQLSDLDDRQPWVVYKASIDPTLVIPTTGSWTYRTKSSVWLFDNGILVLLLTATLDNLGGRLLGSHLPEPVDSVANYLGDDKTLARRAEETLSRIGAALRKNHEALWPPPGHQPRERLCIVKHPYPTLFGVAQVEGSDIGKLDLANSCLAPTTRLHSDEMTSLLSTHSLDFLAVGYDSVWLIQGGPWSSRRMADAKERRVRLPAFIALHLALWMQMYILETELEILLAKIRTIRRELPRETPRPQADTDLDIRANVSALRGELEIVARQLTPQRLSTWSDEVRLFAAIRQSWFFEDSLKSLHEGFEALHRELVELEQNRLTFLASVFAGAGVAGMLIAAATLLLSKIELAPGTEQRTWLGVKIAIIAVSVWLPAQLISPLIKRWGGVVSDALLAMVRRKRGPRPVR